ncbi:MAG: hypothetical protein HUJ42_02165 [Malacoplasma sp.]|nr:hypothetical protein [Malacoplasma sp.]
MNCNLNGFAINKLMFVSLIFLSSSNIKSTNPFLKSKHQLKKDFRFYNLFIQFILLIDLIFNRYYYPFKEKEFKFALTSHTHNNH